MTEAERLAVYLDDLFDADGEPKAAAAELRRLSAINAELSERLVEAMSIINHYGMHGWSKAAHDEGERVTKGSRKALEKAKQ